ncbi:MAG: FtsK/SpoIIIE domain-containing protein [Nocardioides sp.]
MRLKLGYRRSKVDTVDIVLTADATASVGDVARELAERDSSVRGRTLPSSLSLSVSGAHGDSHKTLSPDRAIGESPLTSGSEIALVDAAARTATTSGQPAAVLRVVGGPVSGSEFMLHEGSSIIGRDPTADVTLDDGFVSKRHARVDIGSSIEVVDLNSANGIEVEGVVVSRLTVLGRQELTIGDSRLSITPLTGDRATSRPEPHAGAIPFNRSPRVEQRYSLREHPRPAVPKEIEKLPFPWLLMLAPVALGIGLFLRTNNPFSLMFVALAPMMMIGNYVTQRARNRRQIESAISVFTDQLTALELSLASELPRERQVRQAEAPSVSEVCTAAFERSELLWTRRSEHWSFLNLRLGTSSLPSRNTVAASGPLEEGIARFTQELKDVIGRYRMVSDVPVVEDLRLAGALGVVGAERHSHEVARGLLMQLAGLHSPAELVITALASPGEASEYDWLAWLPHVGSAQSPLIGSHLADSGATAGHIVAQLEDLIEARLGLPGATPTRRGCLDEVLQASTTGGDLANQSDEGAAPGPALVVLITQQAPIDRARVVQMCERAADAGIYPLWLATETQGLPAVCRTFVDVSLGFDRATANFVRHGVSTSAVRVEGISRQDAMAFARALAPLSDAGAVADDVSDLPQEVTLLSLLGADLARSPSVAVDRWRQNHSMHSRGGVQSWSKRRAATLRAIVGQSGVDAMHLDLRAHGPHALVGGTPGSGKSEFLQAWVLSMAVEYSPDRLTFLFVDYKGGAAFADCVKLPHSVGLVTDLNRHLVRRVLTSLKAELTHRERVLNRKTAKDLLELEKRGDPDCPPALVLVIDEFKALADDVPEFVDGVVDIAQRGRSLGMHLIMATQRPAGVIKDNLRANTNLRIALRMADESDSLDVLGTPEAATLDPSIPGRGIAKTGHSRLTRFQAAYAGGRTANEIKRPSVLVHTLGFGAEQPWEKPDAADGVAPDEGTPTDQARLVECLIAAAALAELPVPRRPWLDELSNAYDLAKLGPRTDAELILGVADLPLQQAQETVSFFPDRDGNLAVYGTGGSGKTVLLRTLACAAGVTPRGGPVHVYCLDFAAGGLRMLEQLPQVGAVIGGDEPERVVRLLRTLRAIADQRARDYPIVDAGNIAEFRVLADRADEPRILLLIDGFAAFRDLWETGAGRAPWYGVFQQLLSDGRQLGIHVVFTADRPASVPGSIAASVPRRVVLRMAEDTMYTSLGVPADVIGPGSPPGRALIDETESQIAILGGSGNVSDQSRAIGKLSESVRRKGRGEATTIGSLPSRVLQADLPATAGGLPVLGIGDADLAPLGFEPSGTFLLGGGPQSGRSNALAVIATSLREHDPDLMLAYIGQAKSPMVSLLEWDHSAVTLDDVAHLARELATTLTTTRDRFAVVVESITDFLGSDAERPLVELIKAVRRNDHLVVAESETSTWMSAYSLLSEIKSGRRGLLLQPDTNEGDLILRTPFPRVSRAEFPPGRGFYVHGGKVQRVQLPVADWLGSTPHGEDPPGSRTFVAHTAPQQDGER